MSARDGARPSSPCPFASRRVTLLRARAALARRARLSRHRASPLALVLSGAIVALVIFRGYLIWASGEFGRCPFDDDGLHESVKSLCGLNGHRSMLLETSAWARAPEFLCGAIAAFAHLDRQAKSDDAEGDEEGGVKPDAGAEGGDAGMEVSCTLTHDDVEGSGCTDCCFVTCCAPTCCATSGTRSRWSSLGRAVALALGFFVAYEGDISSYPLTFPLSAFGRLMWQAVGYTLIAVAVATIADMALDVSGSGGCGEVLRWVLSLSVWWPFAALAYSAYLCQMAIDVVVYGVWLSPLRGGQWYAERLYLTALALNVAAALALSLVVERPGIKLRNRFAPHI